MKLRVLGWLCLVMLVPSYGTLLVGCDITKITANGTSELFRRGAPGFEQHFDYELAGEALPGNIMQMEGLLRIVPENEIIVMNAVRLYSSYSFGWLEDEIEVLRMEHHHAEADRLTTRVRYLYLRAHELAKHYLALDHEGFEEKYQEGLEPFRAWLQEEFDDEEDAEGLLWAGYTWGSYINASKNDMVAVADLPFAEALVARSVELDPTEFNGAGLTFQAVVATTAPGGNLDEAEALWNRAIEVTERRNLLTLCTMAKAYAVRRGDRELFVSLLREVLEAGDIFPEARLTNMIAKHRAERYLRQVDELFPE